MPKDESRASNQVNSNIHPCDPCQFCKKGRRCELGGDTENPPTCFRECGLHQKVASAQDAVGKRLIIIAARQLSARKALQKTGHRVTGIDQEGRPRVL